jgi:hypothetical protein
MARPAETKKYIANAFFVIKGDPRRQNDLNLDFSNFKPCFAPCLAETY